MSEWCDLLPLMRNESARRPPAGGLGALLVPALLLLSACGAPSAEYARAACADIASLVSLEARDQAKIDEFLIHAAARAQRASNTDGSFTDLYEDLRTVRDAFRTADNADAGSLQDAKGALVDVGTACERLGVAVQPEGGSLADLSPWASSPG